MAGLHTQVDLHPRVEAYLRGLEAPIRVLRGTAGEELRPPESWAGMARDNGTSIENCENQGLTIVSWGAPATQRWRTNWRDNTPAEFYNDNCYRPKGQYWTAAIANRGYRSYQVSDGTIFAISRGRTVWYAFPISSEEHGGPIEQNELNLEYVFQPIRDVIGAAAADGGTAAVISDEEAALQAELAAHDLFVHEAEAAASRMLGEARREVNNAETNIRSYEQRIREQVDARRQGIRRAESLQDDPELAKKQAEEQWQLLKEHPKVERLGAEGDSLVVTTPMLTLTDPRNDESVDLGRMEIKLPAPATGLGVRFLNLTQRPVDQDGCRRDHPHINAGAPCWGGHETLVSELTSTGNRAALFEVCLQYLETFNPEDCWGVYADLWFGEGQYDQTRIDQPEPLASVVPEAGAEPTLDDDEGRCNCRDCRFDRGELDGDEVTALSAEELETYNRTIARGGN